MLVLECLFICILYVVGNNLHFYAVKIIHIPDYTKYEANYYGFSLI